MPDAAVASAEACNKGNTLGAAKPVRIRVIANVQSVDLTTGFTY